MCSFGDGVNGARLPTGVNNVVATYRIGAGAASPPAGKLTVIAQSYPGLRSVLNPVAVGGGADPDPPDQIRRYAPRSVLTFGRAVSVFDYEALAAQAPGRDAGERRLGLERCAPAHPGDGLCRRRRRGCDLGAKQRAGGSGRSQPAGAGGAGDADRGRPRADAGGHRRAWTRPDQLRAA